MSSTLVLKKNISKNENGMISIDTYRNIEESKLSLVYHCSSAVYIPTSS